MQKGSTTWTSTRRASPVLNSILLPHQYRCRRPRPKPFFFNCQTVDNSTPSILTHISNIDRVLSKPSMQTQTIHGNGHYPQPTATTTTTSPHSFLDSFNLSSFFSTRKPEETTSPRSLTYLQQLLCSSPKPSPRNSIAQRWRDLHGSDNWSTLLDPLDEDLRRELVRYGEHANASYNAFFSKPAPNPNANYVTLPDQTYRVTGHLHATSSIKTPPWVDASIPWASQKSSWIGYVAVCDDHDEIQRMGRRDVVISLRGTATCLEWAENLRDVLVPIPDSSGPQTVQPKVESGFLNLFKTRPPCGGPSLSESVVHQILQLMNTYKDEEVSITITGHSLGAALSLLIADELSVCAPRTPQITVFSFGGPRVGNRGFADRVEGRGVKVLRIVNQQDVVTRLPGLFVNEEVDRSLRANGGGGGGAVEKVLDVLDGSMPWAYSHVGRELRLDSKCSPILREDADFGCCHDLEAYLHLVDGFVGRSCGFRLGAKRSVRRLVRLQGPNMKKLCTRKVEEEMLTVKEPCGARLVNREI